MNLNLKIIILISLVGIFTVSSFIFDQMVIYSEDKIREKNFLYKRSFNNYQSSKNIMINTRDLMARIQVKKDFFDDRQTFLQDTITILLNKDLIRKTFDENVSPDYFKNLNTIFTSRYKKVGIKTFMLNDSNLPKGKDHQTRITKSAAAAKEKGMTKEEWIASIVEGMENM